MYPSKADQVINCKSVSEGFLLYIEFQLLYKIKPACYRMSK